VPKGLSAPIVVDLYPSTAVGLASLLQGEGDVAKCTPAARIKEVRLGGCKRIRPNSHIVVKSRVIRRSERSRESEAPGDRGSGEMGQRPGSARVSRPTARRTATISCPGELAYKCLRRAKLLWRRGPARRVSIVTIVRAIQRPGKEPRKRRQNG